jgi:hypothetical protein
MQTNSMITNDIEKTDITLFQSTINTSYSHCNDLHLPSKLAKLFFGEIHTTPNEDNLKKKDVSPILKTTQFMPLM